MHTALLLEMAAEGLADRIAVGTAREGLTYGALLARARRAAAHILAQPAAQTIAYVGLNSEAFPIALFAASLANRPLAPLNYRLPDQDLRRILARTVPSLAIVDDSELHRIKDIAGVHVIARSEFLIVCGSEEGALASPPPPAPGDIAILLFTSGTTGEPKAAVLRHHHLTSYVLSTVEFMGAADEEAALISVPPYHIAGVSAVLTSTYLGRRMVQLEAFSPQDWIKSARDEHITHAMMVPTMMSRVLDVMEQSGERLPHLRHLSYGGGRMPAATIERAMTLLPHVDFVNAYGLTETSSTIAVLTPDDHRNAIAGDDAARKRLGSVGRPLPTLELEIRGPDGTPLGSNEAGAVWVRGEQVAGEYLSHKSIQADGWFPTNDCGWLDEDGFLFIDGRLDDVIVRGGENIAPGEIEDVLRAHPAVSDVAIIGVPDAEWGERIVAVVVPAGAAPHDDLRAWVRSRLRSTKTPEEIHFRDELPYNETGKLLRRVLKVELASARHGTA